MREFRLPFFELSGGLAATAVSEEVTGAVESARKRDADPSGCHSC